MSNLLDVCGTDPFTYFEKFPIREVREKCLKKMRDNAFFRHHADWAERIIHLLRQMGENQMAQELLGVYVFQVKDDENIIRAIHFLIEEEGPFTSEKSKLLCGRMLGSRDPAIRLYSKIPGLKKFLEELLNRIVGRGRDKKRQYGESEWFETERALKIIMASRDWKNFLGQVEWLIDLHQQKTIYLDRHEPEYVAALHLAMIKETVKVLRRAKRYSEEEE